MITANGLIKLGFLPDVDFVAQDDGSGTYIREWKSAAPQPSESEIEAADAQWQTEYDSQAYSRNREAEYPNLNDLIVALWESVVEERTAAVTELEIKRQAVKDKYPKAD